MGTKQKQIGKIVLLLMLLVMFCINICTAPARADDCIPSYPGDWSDPISLDLLEAPEGKTVSFTAIHQAALKQHVRILNSDGEAIDFELIKTEDDRSQPDREDFPISGQGTSIGFFQYGAGHFEYEPGMTVQFANNGTCLTKAMHSNPSPIYVDGKKYGGVLWFVAEDFGGAREYDDTTLVLEWYEKMG